MTEYRCEICGRQKAENFRFEYGIETSYSKTQTGTTANGIMATTCHTYQSKTTYRVLGEDALHLCLNCIKDRVKVSSMVNYVPIGVGLLLFLLLAGICFQGTFDEEFIAAALGMLCIAAIPSYFITRTCIIRYYKKKLNIYRKEIKQVAKSGKWKDKVEVVKYYQYEKIKPLERTFKENGQLKVQENGIEKDKELMVIPAFVYDDTKDPDFKKIYRI